MKQKPIQWNDNGWTALSAANANGTWTLTFAGGDAALCRTVG